MRNFITILLATTFILETIRAQMDHGEGEMTGMYLEDGETEPKN